MKRMLMMLSLGALLLHVSCKSEHQEKEEEVKFLVTNPIRKDTIVTKDYVSQIQSSRHIELRAQERGYLQEIFVDEGQSVKKGQLLFQILPRIYEAEVQKSKSEAEVAKIEYQNTKLLADSDVVSKNELAMAKAKMEKANAELSLANVHLSFTQIRAPFDGIVDRFHVRLGSLVDEGELLTTLSDNATMWVYYNVPEAEYLDYKTNLTSTEKPEVNLLMANNAYFKYPGVVETIEADFNSETGNIPFRATFPNPDGLLRHGETGNIHVTIPITKALLIPQKSTFEVLDKKYVYVIDKDDRIKSREIKIEAEMPHLYVISEGLSENDKILLEGLRLVRENDKIEYEVKDSESVISNLDLYAE